MFQLGTKPIRDCIGCGQCGKLGGRCTFDDDVVNRLIAAAEQADRFVFGSPVYYAHPSGRILSALDRAFMQAGMPLRTNPAPQSPSPVARHVDHLRCAQQVLHHQPDARGCLHLLE